MQTNTITTAEEKGAKFLQWIADNQKELVKAVKKNITYDPDIFDDVFNESILNVYNTIVKNNQEIANIKNYFFLACKWQYQMRQNQHRKHTEAMMREGWQHLSIIDETPDEEAKDADITEAIDQMKECLLEQFGEDNTEMFFVYWEGKCRNDMNYQTIAEQYSLTLTAAKRIISEMKQYVVNEMPYIKTILTNAYD